MIPIKTADEASTGFELEMIIYVERKDFVWDSMQICILKELTIQAAQKNFNSNRLTLALPQSFVSLRNSFINDVFSLWVTFTWNFMIKGSSCFLFYSDLSYNQLEQLPPRALYENTILSEL